MLPPPVLRVCLPSWSPSRLSWWYGVGESRYIYKPDLIKWSQLRDRIHRKIVKMGKVATANMPVDSMTKWMKAEKVDEQIAYLTNARHAVWP